MAKLIFIASLSGFISLFSLELLAFAPYQQEQELSDTTYIKQLIDDSEFAIIHGQFEQAYNYLREAKKLSDSLDYLPGQALAASSLASAFLQQQKLDSAFTILNHAISNYAESDQLYDFYNLLGTVYNYRKQHEEALSHYRKSLSLISLLPENEQARVNAGISQNMAGVFLDVGKRAEAFEHYLNAVRFSEMTKDTLFWVITLNNIGNAYNSIDDHDNATFYLEKGKKIAEEKNLKTELYRINLNLANARTDQKRFDEARNNYLIALELLQEIRPGSPPVQILYNLGKLNTAVGNFEEADKYFRESLGYSEELEIPQGLYYNNYGLGKMYYELNDLSVAISHLETSLNIAEKLQNVPFIQESRKLLYQVYRDAGQFENAFFQLEKFHAATDSLFGIEKAQALANMESQLALDRQNEINRLLQEKQVHQERRLQFQLILIITAIIIIILVLVILFMMKRRAKEREKINRQLKVQKEELEEINRAKNKLFSIVAHELRSPLSSLQGILYLIKNKVLSNEDIQKFAQELEVSVSQNVDTMEDLLAWASEQLSGVKMEVEPLLLHNIADDVLKKLSYAAERKSIDLINELEKDIFVLGDHNALQLVFRNLVSNSIKFTAKEGKITISAAKETDRVQISVSDTGIGIQPEDFEKVFSSKSWTRKGTENEKGTGLGLNLCKDFIEKMNGEIRFESEPGKGTTFIFSLPIAAVETDQD